MTTTGGLRRLDTTVSVFLAVSTMPAFAMIAALSVVARNSNVEEWSGLGVGASIGGVAALIVLYGWTLSGPVDVARADPGQRRRLYWQSIADRLVLLGISIVPSAACVWLIVPSSARSAAIGMTAATCLNGFSALWYAVGTGEPGLCLRREVIPKTFGILLGAAVVGAGAPIWVFPSGVALGSLVGLVAVSRTMIPAPGGLSDSFRGARSSLRSRSTAGASEIAAGGYSLAGAALVGVLGSPLVTALYVSGDRIFRAGLIAVSSLAGALQRSVSGAASSEFRRRSATAFAAHAVLGVFGLLGLAFLGRPASRVLFGDEFVAPQSAMAAFGVAFFAISLNTTIGRHVLASQGRVTALLVGTTAGVIVGVPAILVGTAQGGVTGAAVGVAASEIVVLAVIGVTALLAFRRVGLRDAD